MTEETKDQDQGSAEPWLLRAGRLSWATLGVVALFLLGAAFLLWLRELVIPAVLAGFLAIVCAPLVTWFEVRGLKRALGAVAVLVLIVGVVAGSVALAVYGVVDRSDELGEWFGRADEELADLLDRFNLTGLVENWSERAGDAAPLAGGGIGAGISTAIGSVVGLVSGLLLGGVLLYYFLKDGADLVMGIAARQPTEKRRDLAERLLLSATQSTRLYFRGRTILAIVQGVAVALALWALGIPLPFAVGIVNLIGAYIPYLGAFVGGAFAVLMGLADGGTTSALAALAVVLFVNLVLENLLEPSLMGSSLDMHPVVVLLITVAGGVMGGIVGLVLAAPLGAIAMNVVRELRLSALEPAAPGAVDPP